MSTYFIDNNDDQELARLQLQDNLFNEIIDDLPSQFHPLDNARALDLGCGPGGWVLKVAQIYPQLSLVGVDISPQMITYARAQAEVRDLSSQFRIMNIVRSPWDFPDGYFDFVNMRFMMGVVPAPKLDSLHQECWRVLKPGGVIRQTETVHLNAPTAQAVYQLQQLMSQSMFQSGFTFSPYEMSTSAIVEKCLKNLHFQDIRLTPYVVNLSYGAPMHIPMLQNLKIAQHLLQPFLIQTTHVTAKALDEMEAALSQEWLDPNFCAHWHHCSVSGIKG